MYKALTRRPLQQAMVVLWLVGVVHLSGWLVDAAPTGKWVASAGMAAFLLMLIGARFRALAVIPVWVALGWAAAWGGAYVLGIDGASGIGFVTAVYAFAVWRTSVSLLASSKLVRVAGFLDLCGGYATPGGRFYVERIIYWSCFALTLLALVINSQRAPLALGVLGVSWPVLAVALLYLFLGGWKYRLVLNTYLSVMLVVLAIISVFLALAGDVVLPLTDLIIGLITALGGFAFWSLGRSINGRTAVDSVVCSLYVTPLRNAALTMAVLSMLQVLVVAPGLPAAPEWHAVIILAVSSVVVLLANRELLLPVLTAVATASASCATVWFYSALVHSRPPFGLYPGSTISNGEWLVIALLTLTQAIAGLALYHRPTWRRAFGVPLLVLALLSFIWSLSGALSLYAAGSAHLPWIVAVLIAALFPLLRPTSQGQELRGVGVALLTSLLAAAILGPDGRATLGAQALLAWAFVLWFIGTLALPRLNASFPDWSVAPSIWPWLGLLALGMGVVHAYSPGILQWHLWVIVAAYLFLMLRHSAWSGFTWLTVGMLSVGIVLFSVDHYQPELASGELHAIGALALHNLVWANVLLALV
ncbi:MAG: hypothetical protein GY794_14450, partial [bacterium]|nr:hypothetical protein [bacterium]